MAWWTEQKAHLKSLRPGMGVKRWVALLICGLALLVLAVAAVAAGELSGLWVGVQQNFAVHAFRITHFGGAAVFRHGSAWYRVGHLRPESLDHLRLPAGADQAKVADVVYRHRQRQQEPEGH